MRKPTLWQEDVEAPTVAVGADDEGVIELLRYYKGRGYELDGRPWIVTTATSDGARRGYAFYSKDLAWEKKERIEGGRMYETNGKDAVIREVLEWTTNEELS